MVEVYNKHKGHLNIYKVKATLEHVFALAPEHITIYRTRYKGTRIKEK